jgi:acyl-CoA synthetase (AMP-forming)/AMP-acid ligase II
MAEATLAVTACPWDQEPKAVALDPVELAEGNVVEMDPDDPRATRVVSTGPPVIGAEFRAGDGTRVEEIEISSASLGAGYYGNAEYTSSRFVNGWFQTGDVGFLREGELYVVGRTDDMVQIAGRSVYANELEAAVANFEEIRNGCTMVLNAPTAIGDELILLAELQKQRKGDLRELARRAARMAIRTMGIAIGQCVFLSRGALPKTPSGKIQRFRAKQLFVTGALEPLGTVRTSG